MVCYRNPPQQAPNQLAEKVAKLSQQHMEKQQQQWQQKKENIKKQIEESDDNELEYDNNVNGKTSQQ